MEQLVTHHAASQHEVAVAVDAVELEYGLGDINAERTAASRADMPSLFSSLLNGSGAVRANGNEMEHVRRETFITRLFQRTEIHSAWQEVRVSVERLEQELVPETARHPNERMCRFLILAEDRRLGRHPGVDMLALCRAAWKVYFCRSRQGGSTIAMQMVRTLTGRYERTLWRKILEICLAVLVSRHVPAARLPVFYLSCAYYGWRMNNFEQACSRLGIDPNSTSALDDAQLVARLKYPQPRRSDAVGMSKITRRGNHILHLHSSLKNRHPERSGDICDD